MKMLPLRAVVPRQLANHHEHIQCHKVILNQLSDMQSLSKISSQGIYILFSNPTTINITDGSNPEYNLWIRQDSLLYNALIEFIEMAHKP